MDPYLGAQLSVAEATRNVSITGARPLGITNCLNYGNPERPEAFWQLQEAVRGMGDACRALDIPVTGGNVSLYNEYPGGAIAPTPLIGVVGLLDDISLLVRPPFTTEGDSGHPDRRERPGPGRLGLRRPGRAGLGGRPAEPRPGARGGPAVVHPRGASGGVWWPRPRTSRAAAWRSPSPNAPCGAAWARRCALGISGSPAIELFGESPSRLVLSCRPRHAAALELLARQFGLPSRVLGTVGGDRLRIELTGQGATGAAEERGSRVADALDVSLADLRHAWDHGLARALGVGIEDARHGGEGRGASHVRHLRRSHPRRRRRGHGGAGRLLAPAPRPGVGRHRRQRRRATDALQGPGPDRPGPRRAAPAEPARAAGHRPLPLLHDRLHGLGERPADLPHGPRPGHRRGPQRQPGQHPRAAVAPGGRQVAPAGHDGHRAADRAPGRRPVRRRRGGPQERAAARPGRLLAGHPRREACHRRARSVRLPAPGPGPPRARRGRPAGHAFGRLADQLRVGGHRRRRRDGRARRRAGRDRDPRGGQGAGLGPLRRGPRAAVRLRADLLRPAGLLHAGPQPLRIAAPHGPGPGRRGAGRRPTW